jgi:hypothetical protein
MPDLGKLMADPDVREAMADPKVVGILQACMADPSQIMQHRCARACAALAADAGDSGARLTSLVRRDNPKVNKLLMALFKQQGPGMS